MNRSSFMRIPEYMRIASGGCLNPPLLITCPVRIDHYAQYGLAFGLHEAPFPDFGGSDHVWFALHWGRKIYRFGILKCGSFFNDSKFWLSDSFLMDANPYCYYTSADFDGRRND